MHLVRVGSSLYLVWGNLWKLIDSQLACMHRTATTENMTQINGLQIWIPGSNKGQGK